MIAVFILVVAVVLTVYAMFCTNKIIRWLIADVDEQELSLAEQDEALIRRWQREKHPPDETR